MKIVSLNTSVSRKNGGVFEVSRRLAQELHRIQPGSIEVLGLEDAAFAADAAGWNPLRPRVFPPSFPKPYGYAPGFSRSLRELQPDVCHAHGLWTYPTLAARRWAHGTRRPYLVTVHGMLDRWALRNSHWKKALVGALAERRNLSDAACLHAITPAEVADIRNYGLSNPVCVIPNGVDLPDDTGERPPAPWAGSGEDPRQVLLYLGRIHPKKGLLPLIEGWALSRREANSRLEGWRLIVAGWDQSGHEAELKARVRSLGLERDVQFIGPQFGAAKHAAYRHADAFILPSFSEGLPLVVLEAWAYRLPVLMTEACNLPEGFAAGAAVRIEPQAESLAQGLEALAESATEELRAMGGQGRALVESRFLWPKVATEVLQIYEWMLGIRARPGNVVI